VSTGGLVMAVALAIAVLSLAMLFFAMLRSIRDERTPGRSTWREFGLSIILLGLFLASWVAQGIAQWQTFTDEERAHGETPELGDFLSQFGQSTFENWQSEFLQVFVFVVLTTFLVHRKSHESPDTDYDTESALRRIEAKVDGLTAKRGS